MALAQVWRQWWQTLFSAISYSRQTHLRTCCTAGAVNLHPTAAESVIFSFETMSILIELTRWALIFLFLFLSLYKQILNEVGERRFIDE